MQIVDEEDEREKFDENIDEKFARFEAISTGLLGKLDNLLEQIVDDEDFLVEEPFVFNLGEPFSLNSTKVMNALKGLACTFLQKENGSSLISKYNIFLMPLLFQAGNMNLTK